MGGASVVAEKENRVQRVLNVMEMGSALTSALESSAVKTRLANQGNVFVYLDLLGDIPQTDVNLKVARTTLDVRTKKFVLQILGISEFVSMGVARWSVVQILFVSLVILPL